MPNNRNKKRGECSKKYKNNKKNRKLYKPKKAKQKQNLRPTLTSDVQLLHNCIFIGVCVCVCVRPWKRPKKYTFETLNASAVNVNSNNNNSNNNNKKSRQSKRPPRRWQRAFEALEWNCQKFRVL